MKVDAMKEGFIVVTAYHSRGDKVAGTSVSPVYLDFEDACKHVTNAVKESQRDGVLSSPHLFDRTEWKIARTQRYWSAINVHDPDRWLTLEIYDVSTVASEDNDE